MNIYLIHAYEGRYNGLHGMSEDAIVEEINEQEARITARNMSLDVMSSYSSIEDELYEEALWYAEDDDIEEGTAEFDELLDEQYKENIAYEIWKLSDKYSADEYRAMLDETDYEEITKYAVSE